jgi:hypothetical protein
MKRGRKESIAKCLNEMSSLEPILLLFILDIFDKTREKGQTAKDLGKKWGRNIRKSGFLKNFP